MIHAIRKLAREIHRRSVWQVLGVYIALSWGLVSAVVAATDLAGLPSWTPTMTAVLLVALLPFVVATAVVREGIPGLRIEDEVDPHVLERLTPEDVHVVPEAHPLHGVGLLTWRNVLLGAITSAALLLTAVVAYLTMWALGIGPVGSLIAQGVLAEGDSVALFGFVNRTDDPSLGTFASDAFELDLAECGVVTLVGSEFLDRVLAPAGRDAAGPPTPAPARQMVAEKGVRVVAEAEISRAGSGYLLTARIVLAGEGTFLARFDETAAGDEALFSAIERLSERVREKLGESLKAIRQGERLGRVTTDSMEALRLYGFASRASLGGDHGTAIRLLEQAIGLDSAFAMGWRKLGLEHEQVGDTNGALEAHRRVVDLWPVDSSGGRRTVRQLRARMAALEG